MRDNNHLMNATKVLVPTQFESTLEQIQTISAHLICIHIVSYSYATRIATPTRSRTIIHRYI